MQYTIKQYQWLIFSQGGRCDWWTLPKSNSPRNTAREISQIIAHAIIEPIQQGLILVSSRESVFLFGASPTPKGNKVPLQSTMLCCDFDLPITAEDRAYELFLYFLIRVQAYVFFDTLESNDNYSVLLL